MSEQQNSLRTIFVEALEIEDAQQRVAFLSRVCGADAALRREVEELSGQRAVPVMVTDGGQVVADSRRIIEWAEANPAHRATPAGGDPSRT